MRILASFLVQLAFASSHPKRPTTRDAGIWRFARDASGEWRETVVR